MSLVAAHPIAPAHPAKAWARLRAWWWLRPGRAVILDTETTDFDGEIIEISIVEAATGAVLIDTLVRPEGPINPEASAVHGLSDADVATAPTWSDLWPQIAPILSNHRVALAYNAPYDAERITAACQRHHLRGPSISWGCVMRLDATYRHGRWRRLDAGHRSLGDTLAALQVLRDIAAGQRQ